MKRSYDEIDRNAKDVDKLWIENAKQDLWSQLREPSVNYLSQVKDDIRSRLDMAFEQRASTSLLVVGPTGSGKKAMIDSVLQSYTHRDEDDDEDDCMQLSCAHVSGQICASDQDALCSIAGQLCLRPSAGRDLSTALEDLEDHFRQCSLNGRPSVIVLEDVHTFATREKQILIYTLLDYMHKPDMLFVVLGCTPCAHLQYMLEKRVLSRLNAQFVYVPPATGQNVCDVLSNCLQLKFVSDDKEQAYRVAFNNKILELFGLSSDVQQKKGSRSISNKKKYKKAELLQTITSYTQWGKGLSHFLRVCQMSICSITSEQPYLNTEMWFKALQTQDPYNLNEKLKTLPLHELHIFACISRLHGRLGDGCNSKGKQNTSSSSHQTKSRTVKVGELLSELDSMTGVMRRNESTCARVLLGLTTLVQEGLILLCGGAGKPITARLVTDETLVLIQVPMYEICAAFQENIETLKIGRKQSSLVISDRVRRAVLEPLEPLTFGVENGVGLM
jgi:Cdc6-like AAA superfamily ATPase